MDGGPAVLSVPRRSFVLVAGIPGAGKSSMLARRPTAARGAVVLDSDPIREGLRAKLPDGTPYRWYRGLVHLWHRVQIVLAVLSTLGPVVVHMPATGAFSRVALVSLAMLAWRRPYLVWVHAEPAEARRGQRARGRVLRRSCFERHARLGAAFVAGLRAGHQPRGWHRVILLDRRRARYGLVLDTEPAEASVGQRSGELPAGPTGQPPRELPTRPAAGEVDAPAERAAG